MDQMFSKWQPTALSLFRFITGLLLLQFGIAKIFKFPALPYFASPPPLIMTAGAIELVLGALLSVPAIAVLLAEVNCRTLVFELEPSIDARTP